MIKRDANKGIHCLVIGKIIMLVTLDQSFKKRQSQLLSSNDVRTSHLIFGYQNESLAKNGSHWKWGTKLVF